MDIIISLLITVVAYCAFPLIFAKLRKEKITKSTYRLWCFIVNGVIMIGFMVLAFTLAEEGANVAHSGAPYVLWTLIFCFAGTKILERRSILAEDTNKIGKEPEAKDAASED